MDGLVQHPVQPDLLPLTAQLRADGHLALGGVDLLDLAGEFGTPLFVYDEEHLRARCSEAVAASGDGVAYATKAFLCLAMARLAHEEGMCLDVSTGGELHVALAAGVPAERLVLHGNNKSDDELAPALAAGVGRIVVDSFDEIERPRACSADAGLRRRRQAVMRPGDAGRRSPYPRLRQDRPGGFEVRFRPRLGRGRPGRRARLRALRGVALVGVHAHIGSQVFRVDVLRPGRRGPRPVLRAARVAELLRRRRARRRLRRGGDRAVHRRVGPRRARRPVAAAGLPAEAAITAEPGRSIVAAAGRHALPGGHDQGAAGLRTYVAVDGGMSDNPRPVLYGSGYEAFLPREAGRPTPAGRPGRGQALRVR